MRLGEQGKETEGASETVMPQEIEVRSSGDAATWNVTINMAEGINQTTPTTTVTIPLVFAAGETLKRYPIPQGTIHQEIYFQLAVQNNQKDVFSRILGLRVYFHVHPHKGTIE